MTLIIDHISLGEELGDGADVVHTAGEHFLAEGPAAALAGVADQVGNPARYLVQER